MAQFLAWQAAPGSPTPLTFWIPDSAWQLASPGWINPIPFWLPTCGINLYSQSARGPNLLPSAPSAVIQVTVSNNSNVAAVNTLVQLSMSYLGIGRKKVPVASQLISIPGNQQVDLYFPTPASFLTDQSGNPQQWLGVYVDIQHPFDSNLANDHATSMWFGFDTTAVGGAGVSTGVLLPLFNEFSSVTEQVTLWVIPMVNGVSATINGVHVAGPVGPFVIAPGAWAAATLGLTIPPNVDGGTFLAPLATVTGTDSNGNFVGGLTIVAGVND